jgi:predicted PurR-regulated permease PerM
MPNPVPQTEEDQPDGGPPSMAPISQRALLWLLLVVSAAFVWILLPFFSAVMWGAIIALLFAPMFRALQRRWPKRPTLAALVTLMAVLLIVIIPFAFITASMAREAAGVYQRIQSGEWSPAQYLHQMFDALPDWVTVWLDRFGLGDFAALQKRLSLAVSQGSQMIAQQALSVGLNTFDFLTSLAITMYLAFFLIRDGAALGRLVYRAIPLEPVHKRELVDKFATVIRATVKGNLVMAGVQGLLGGLAFWFLGVNASLLWAAAMAFLSLLPAVGAGLVWLPVAVYFLVSGQIWQGVALILWGLLVIGLVDNLLRPVLVGKDTRMPDYVVMISTIGGIAAFGINGFVIGPTIAAMFMAVWAIFVSTQP